MHSIFSVRKSLCLALQGSKFDPWDEIQSILMNIKIGILNVPKHCNKHDLIHFVTPAKFCFKYMYVWLHFECINKDLSNNNVRRNHNL